MKKLIVMMSPAGSGKTILAKYIKKTHDDCVIVSRDKIRYALFGDASWSREGENKVKQNYYDAINSMMATHDIVIADATQVTLESRQALFDNLELPSDIKTIGIWLETSLPTCVKNNKSRKGKSQVPEKAIDQMFKDRVSPRDYEPFDDIVYIMSETNQASRVSDPIIRSVVDTLRLI